MQRIIPSHALKSCIYGFFVLQTPHHAHKHLLLADGLPTLSIRAYKNEFISRQPTHPPQPHPSVYFSNRLRLRHRELPTHDADYLLLVRFNPCVFYRLFGLDARLLREKEQHRLHELFAHAAHELEHDLLLYHSIHDKIAVLEAFVLKHLHRAEPCNKLLETALRIIRQEKGLITIHDLSGQLHVNYKWLERNFKQELGFTPKEYANRQHFIHVCHELINSAKPDMLQIAARYGFHDHTYLVKDFKRHCGLTPKQYHQLCTEHPA